MLDPIPNATINAIKSPKIPEVVKLPQPMTIIPDRAINIIIQVTIVYSFKRNIEKIAAKIGAAAINNNVLATEVFCIE